MLRERAAALRPERLELGEHALAEEVARPREREGGVRVPAACLFAPGLSFGRALDEGPSPGDTRTLERTLKPLPLAPVSPPTTVTVTVTEPG